MGPSEANVADVHPPGRTRLPDGVSTAKPAPTSGPDRSSCRSYFVSGTMPETTDKLNGSCSSRTWSLEQRRSRLDTDYMYNAGCADGGVLPNRTSPIPALLTNPEPPIRKGKKTNRRNRVQSRGAYGALWY